MRPSGPPLHSPTLHGDAMPIAFDVISQLTELSWRGISAPASLIETAFDQNVQEHLRPGEDDGHLETTGRSPLQVSATLHFRNAIFASKGDTWKSKGPLYPEQWLGFLDACADGTTGELIHPILGPMNAKVISFRSSMSADKRDGEDVQVIWKRTLVEGNNVELLGKSSVKADALTAAAALDEIIFVLPLEIRASDPDDLIETFVEAVTDITSAVDQVSLAARQLGGKVDRVVYRCEMLMDTVQRIFTPQFWPMKHTINRLIEATRRLQKSQLQGDKPVSLYINPKPQTVPMLATFLGNSVADILALNPSFTGLQLIAPRVLVRFYTQVVTA